MILLVDNYDSFSYNLYQLVGKINPDIKVIRNDELTVDEIIALAPSHIIISPGPGKPSDAGVCEELVVKAAGKVPILGGRRRKERSRKAADARQKIRDNRRQILRAVQGD